MEKIVENTVIKGKYQIIEHIAKGSVGDDVYKGLHLEMDKEILIRIMPPAMTLDKILVKRFIQQIRLTAQLQHFNILMAYEAGEEDGNLFLVTAYEKGFFLREYLEHRGDLSEDEAVSMMIELCEAMSYAWENSKIVHRNLRPETILVARGNHPMVTDFGMAKPVADSQGSELTMAGFTIGNPQYMSPEQVACSPELDFRADMYCLGLVFYEMLTGHAAVTRGAPVEMMDAQLNEDPPELAKEKPQISKYCVRIVEKMIRKEPDKRYSSWNPLIDDLKKLRKGNSESEKDAKKIKPTAKKMKTGPKPKEKKSKKIVSTSRRSSAGSTKTAPVANSSMVMLVVFTAIVLLVLATVTYFFLTDKKSNEKNHEPTSLVPTGNQR